MLLDYVSTVFEPAGKTAGEDFEKERTGRLLMNGLLLQSGQDIISIPAAKRQEFDEKMIRFYETSEANEMMTLLSRCQIRSKFE